MLSERNSAAAARPQRRLKGRNSQRQCGYVLQPLDLTLTFAQHRVACCMLYVACWTYLGWFAQYDATVRIAHRLARFACELVGSTELLLKHSQDRPVQHATPNIAWARYSIVRTATVQSARYLRKVLLERLCQRGLEAQLQFIERVQHLCGAMPECGAPQPCVACAATPRSEQLAK